MADRRHDRSMRRNLNVPLNSEAVAALVELARREYREPREQAAFLIQDGLRRAGIQADVRSAADPRPEAVAR